jgi:alpha-tubulin suppressor-like RCC1 family protein
MCASPEASAEYAVFAQALAWGCARHGQLGAGPEQRELSEKLALAPMRVGGLEGHDLAGVFAGFRHAGFVTAEGQLLMSGAETHGRLGHSGGRAMVPRPVGGLAGVRVHSAAAGQRHTLVLATTGVVYSFGCGLQGQLGHGDLLSSPEPRAVDSIRPGSGPAPPRSPAGDGARV